MHGASAANCGPEPILTNAAEVEWQLRGKEACVIMVDHLAGERWRRDQRTPKKRLHSVSLSPHLY